MDIMVKHLQDQRGELRFADLVFPCALGKAGVTPTKKEGDHASPIGSFALRGLYFRADKLGKAPVTSLTTTPITQYQGWCDDPDHKDYNRPITLPFDASHETMWRGDDLYDLVVILGHNDTPPVPGCGSCIFMHVAKPGFEGTEGCIALEKSDFLILLQRIQPATRLIISA